MNSAPLPRATHPGPASASSWLAVFSLAVSTFTSVTTEFLPIGLLTDIAATLRLSEGEAGLMVMLPGAVAALTGPALSVGARRLDRRTLLLALSVLLITSNLLAAVAQNLPTLLTARVLLGMVVGGFWTFAPGATASMVPAAQGPRAISYVLAGISVATVAGVPAGALLGNLAGWRSAFFVTAALAAAVLVLQFKILPSIPAARALRPRDLLSPLQSRSARRVLAVALLMMAGHFIGYTYLTPVLQQVFGIAPDGISVLLLIYGAAGLGGTFLGGQLVVHSVKRTSLMAALAISGVLFFAALTGEGRISAAIAAFVWGGAFGLVPVAMTTWMQRALRDTQEAGQALLVTFFQAAIAAGAFIGGYTVDAFSITSALMLGGTLALLAALVVAVSDDLRSID
jgi:predicted MFS family arabinose efflux permease